MKLFGNVDKVGAELLKKPQTVTEEDVARAISIMQKYKQGKKALEDRVKDDEMWYQLRHWEALRKDHPMPEPSSAWLFNAIANKHADAMDNFPRMNVLPRAQNDKEAASNLSEILPCILE